MSSIQWPRLRTGLVIVSVLMLFAAACGGEDETPATTAAPAPAAPEAEAPAETEAEPVMVEGEAVKLGYISGGDSDPFVFIVTESIRDAAAAAGAELFECDANFSTDTAIQCARTLDAQGLGAVINWQFFPDAAPAVCEAYGDLPTVTMDVPQGPCERVFVGSNGYEAGLVAGAGLGDYAQSEFGCEYDLYVSIENLSSPDINAQRAGGSREGFEGVCGSVSDDKFRIVDKRQGGSDALENVRRQFTDILTTVPDATVILVMSSFGDPDAAAAFAAAETQGRGESVFIVGHGADASAWSDMLNNPQWIGDVAYFPDLYGSLAVPAAIALAKGETPDREIFIDHQFLNASNLTDYYPEAAGLAEAPVMVEGEAVKLGYISGGDSDPFVFIVTESIRDAAAAAGAELFECDANFSTDTAIQCARTLDAQGLGAVINWQFFPDAAPAVCEAYGDLPTVTMDVPQGPCERVFVGSNGYEAGLVAGAGLGDYAQSEFGCEYDLYVSIENLSSPDINAQRAGGSREGFEGVCGSVSDDKFRIVDKRQGGSDALENVRRQFTDILTTVPDATVILVMSSFGDPDAAAAFAAAETQGRGESVFIVGHGADASAWSDMLNNPQWIGDVAYFPDLYGSLAVPAAIALAKGETPDREIFIDHQFLNASNLTDYYPEAAG